MTLLSESKLEVGYIIQDIADDPIVAERMSELGLIPGREVVLMQKLPFHGPLIVKIQSTYISLRLDEAARVVVKEQS